ncbi:MAG TPA: AAA family ATPase [Solirubrobacteraceae bacterium]|nr:AAA family ATPase [Solirubrobacteraceae bacterium]
MIAPGIVGRDAELRRIIDAIDDIERHGRALLLRGEAGIGKSALLEAAHVHAVSTGRMVLSTAGVETESALGYAGLHRLLRPLVPRIDALSDVQRRALRAALGVGDDPAGEPFLVALAARELLAAQAQERPIVVIADDLHWLDGASRTVLGIVGRRIGEAAIVLLAAVRDGYDASVGNLELDNLPLHGLDRAAAAEILDGRSIRLPGQLRARLLTQAAGNPLALIELPAVATVETIGYDEGAALPISTRLEQAFASRMREMPLSTREVLLIAACDQASAVDEVLLAARRLGGPRDRADFSPAVEAGLVGLHEGTIRYRHPLVRSAIYQSAPLEARLAAHGAWAQTVKDDPDRRAWHRAAATVRRDDDVAREVEAAAGRARARGAVLEAAVMLARAAGLTENVELRADRLLRSAELALDTGRPDLVRDAVEEAQRLSLGVRDRARAQLLSEGFSDGVVGDVDRVLRLIDQANEVSSLGDVEFALDLLRGAAVRCWWAALEATVRMRVLSAAEKLAVSPVEPRLIAIMACAAPIERGAEVVGRVPAALAAAGDDPLGRWFVAMAAHAAGDHAQSLSILADLAPELRGHGRFGLLTQVLSMMQWDAALVGDWDVAEATATEGNRLALDTGQRIWGAGITCGLSAAAAVRGDCDHATDLARQAESVIVTHGLADMHSVLLTARGIAAVADGRYDDAFAVLCRAFDPADPAFHYREQTGALTYFAEAAAGCRRVEEARVVIEGLAALAEAGAAPALTAEIEFAVALLGDHLGLTRSEVPGPGVILRPFNRGRLRLARGKALGRAGEVTEAARLFGLARADFVEAASSPWRARADAELAAAGVAG